MHAIKRFQRFSWEVFRRQQIFLSIFSPVNLNISICLPTFKKEPRNSKRLMSTSEASFQQIADSDKRMPVELSQSQGSWTWLLMKIPKTTKHPKICRNIFFLIKDTMKLMHAKLYQNYLQKEYHGNTELVFFLHRTEIPCNKNSSNRKPWKININNVNDI